MQKPTYIMKHLYALLLILCSGALAAQDYVPFNSTSVKTFASYPAQSATYSLGFDSVSSAAGFIVYYPYMGIEDYEIELGETCTPLGENLYCFPETKPLWLGANITTDGSGNYMFTNSGQNVLPLNFNLPQGTSVVFYEDSVSRFTLTGLPKTYETILGVPDSIAGVAISHTDLNGIPINSPLNGFVIKTGKESGLVTFFRTDSFPQILEPVIVIANQNPQTGLTDIINEDLYDFQPGDQIQYNEKSELVSCHTEVLYDRFVNLTFLQRTDTQDSIIYTALRETFMKDSLNSVFDTSRMAYARQTVVAQMPYDYNAHGETYNAKTLGMEDYCGVPMWTYTLNLMNLSYCEASDCWGMPLYYRAGPSVETETVVMGLGRYYYFSSTTIELNTFNYTYRVNYFKKSNLECGTEQVVAVNDISKPEQQLSIMPNPATDYITITGIPRYTPVQLINLNGQTVKSIQAATGTATLNVSGIQKGVYIVRAGEKRGKVVVE